MTNACPTCQRERYVGESCQRLACIWADLAGVALELDCFTIPGSTLSGPRAIKERILATHDRLPGGAQSSETGVRSARMEPCEDITCPGWHPDIRHDHPCPVDPTGDAAMRPSKSEADLAALQTAVSAFVAAVGELAVLSHSRGRPRSWGAAVTDASILAEWEAVDSLETSGQKPRKWVLKAADALHDLELIRDRHCPRDASDHERTWTSGLADEECCLVCFQLGLRVTNDTTTGGRLGLCQSCYRLRLRCAEVNDIDTKDAPVPPPELVQELRRIGAPGSAADRATRSRWFQAVGRLLADERGCA